MIEQHGLDAKRRTCGLCQKWLRAANGAHWCAISDWLQIDDWPEYASACALCEGTW